jgi:hypothetical protein
MKLMDWFFGRDRAIDALIDANAAKAIEGMEAIDWSKTNRAGRQKWNEVAAGQGKARATVSELRRVK